LVRDADGDGRGVISSTLAVGPIGLPAKRSSKRSLASLMISSGGLKRRRFSGPASTVILIERVISRAVGCFTRPSHLGQKRLCE
jgi:hypothetical protein